MEDTDDIELIRGLKIELYDVIERQALIRVEFDRLEHRKAELAQKLGDARRAVGGNAHVCRKQVRSAEVG